MRLVYRCGDCQFCAHVPDVKATCRVSPPAEWRDVTPDDWCGKFQAVNSDLPYYTPPRAADLERRFPNRNCT